MPQIIKDADGNDLEVFTKEETDALAQQKADQAAADKQAEIDLLETEKAEKEAELEKERQKDKNFDRFRKQTEAERAVEKAANEDRIAKEIENINKRLDSVAAAPINDVKTDFIKEHVGNDKEKNERFEYYFKRLGTEAKTKEEVLKAANEALQLATNGGYKPNTDSRILGTGVDHNYRGGSSSAPSEAALEIGRDLGISDEDRKKYGKKN